MLAVCYRLAGMVALSKSNLGVLLALVAACCAASCRRATTIGADNNAPSDTHRVEAVTDALPDANSPARLLHRRPEGGTRNCQAVGNTLYVPETDAVVEVGEKVIRHDAPGLVPSVPLSKPTWVVVGNRLFWSTKGALSDLEMMELTTHRRLPPLHFREIVQRAKSIDGELVLLLANDTCGSKTGCYSIFRLPTPEGALVELLAMQPFSIIDYAWNGDDLYWTGTVFDHFVGLFHTQISTKKTTTVLKTHDRLNQLRFSGSELWYAREGELSKLVGDKPVVMWDRERISPEEPFIVSPPHIFAISHNLLDIDIEAQSATTLFTEKMDYVSEIVRVGNAEFRWCTSDSVLAWP